MPISSSYNPKEYENKIYQEWMEAKLGSPERQLKEERSIFSKYARGGKLKGLEVQIRVAKAEDARAVFETRKIGWLETYPNEEFNITKEDLLARNWSFDKFKQEFEQNLENEKMKTWVAEIENQIVGHIFADLTEDSEENLAINLLSQFQSKGIGSQLMLRALEFLQPLEEISFGVAQYNQKAINFYQKFGFEIIGETESFKLNEQKSIPLFRMILSGEKVKGVLGEILKHSKMEGRGLPLQTDNSFTILMPPPNLTGDLHAGHAYEHYVMDTLTRINRQKGKSSLYLPGVDHAGIQLEGVVDKLIKKGEFDEVLTSPRPPLKGEESREEGKVSNEEEKIEQGINLPADRNDWPKFLKQHHSDLWLELAWSKVNLWRDNQKKAAAVLGDTPDFERQLFTLDEQAVDMVNYAFIQYWKDGLIYKGSYMINWSVALQTALSDVPEDVEWVEQKDPFVTFEYEAKEVKVKSEKLKEKFKDLIENYLKPCSNWPRIKVSTVRPETIFGDVAVAMHPSKFNLYFSPSQIFKQQIGNEDNFEDGLMEEFLEAIRNGGVEVFYALFPLKVDNIKLIFATEVDANFGSGTLKVTPASDQVDYDIYKKYLGGQIPQAIDRSGKLTEICGEFAGFGQICSEAFDYQEIIGKWIYSKKS